MLCFQSDTGLTRLLNAKWRCFLSEETVLYWYVAVFKT